jgi:hypothetical protein
VAKSFFDGQEAGGGEEARIGSIIATIHLSRACCGKIVLRRSGSADCWSYAHLSRVAERIPVMGSKVVPAPDTSRWRIDRHHSSHLRELHAVGRARGDTGCSGGHPCLRSGTTRIFRHVSLPAENITHTAAKITVRLVLVKGNALQHAVLATHARTEVANLPSPIDLLQKWTGLLPEYALICLPGDGNDWQPGTFSSALQRSSLQ